MKLSDLNEWLTLTANLGVIGGIVFLAVEIQQNTAAIETQTYQARAFEASSSLENTRDAIDFIPIYSLSGNGTDPDYQALDALSENDKLRLWFHVRALMSRADNNLYQCERGNLDGVFCAGFETYVSNNLSYWEWVANATGNQIDEYLFRILELR